MAVVTGDAQLRAALKKMSLSPAAAEIDASAIASLEPLKDETQALAPRPSLKAGVRIRRRVARGRGERTYWVSFARGVAMRIAHLVEFGTQPHSVRKGASVRKGIFVGQPPMHPGTRPEPFFRPAFEATKHEVVAGFGKRMWALIAARAGKIR